MTNSFVKGISDVLKKEFPESEIYLNEIKQGFKESCFLITLLNSSDDRIHSNRKFKKYNFIIQCFVENNDKEMLFEISDKLETILEYIDVGDGGLFMGKDIKRKMVNGILNFQVSYSTFIKEINPNEVAMSEIKIELTAGGQNG